MAAEKDVSAPRKSECPAGALPRRAWGARFHGGDADPGRHHAVDHALAEAGRQAGSKSLADDLVNEIVARRYGARHREMGDDAAPEPKEAEGAGAGAVKLCDSPNQRLASKIT